MEEQYAAVDQDNHTDGIPQQDEQELDNAE
jgi:hypothetical protein